MGSASDTHINLVTSDLLLIVSLVENSDQEVTNNSSHCVRLAISSNDGLGRISSGYVTLNEEGRSRQCIEGPLSVELHANVHLVIANLHKGVLNLVLSNINVSQSNGLQCSSADLHQSDLEHV